jgi:hypothetical protein
MPVSTRIKGGISNPHQQKEDKYKKSNFHLTISTNKKYDKDDANLQNDMEVFDDTISSILNHIENYVKLPETDKWDDDKIKDVDIDYVVELGNQKNRLHAHVLFRFLHRSKVQLDYDAIKKKICEDLGVNNVYLYNRLVRPSEGQNIVSYLSKYRN